MNFITKFKLFEKSKNWNKNIDPFDEEYWNEESILDKKNYIEYDNIENNHSNYPIDAPVMLKEGNEHRRGLTTAILKPFELGFIKNTNIMEPTYNVLWVRRGRNNRHFSYDLLYHKDYIPSDWTPGIRQDFKMNNKLYQLIFSWSNRTNTVTYNIEEMKIQYNRRRIDILNSVEYFRGIPLNNFRQFINNDKFGYLQEKVFHRGYNKDILFFTSDIDIDTIKKPFTILIKRRIGSIQAKLTRSIKKFNSALYQLDDKIKYIKNKDLNIYEFDYNKAIEETETDWIGAYFSNNGRSRLSSNVSINQFGRLTTIKMGWTRFNVNQFEFNDIKYKVILYPDKTNCILIINKKYFNEIKDEALKEFMSKTKIMISNYIDNINDNKRIIENKIETFTEKKKILTKEKREFDLNNIIGDYIN